MIEILKKVNSPSDLKGLTLFELEHLAEELRSEIVRIVSLNGGHLASSLGAVELTIALHRCFNSPQDKIIWDVGHQSYAHKLLTGRKERFETIRQYGGLSGFPTREESEHDAFNAGHAGTSVSAAVGMAIARDLNKEKYEVVAVIGDGSLGTGMAFEAINHAGHQGTKLIVVLNDNGMSISPSVGAVSRLLNQVRLNVRYENAKRKVKGAVTSLPFGQPAWKLSKMMKSRFERVLLPNAFWEELGFTYLGPLDGHNLREIEAALIRARDMESGPVVIHALTTKGKGYAAAEDNAIKFHGISPDLGAKPRRACSYSQILGQTLLRLMQENGKIVAISAAMLDGTGMGELARQFPKRVFDVGICEQHAVTMAAGMATQGFIPVVAVYSTFLQRAYDQVIHDVCIPGLPVILAIDRAGIVGDDGVTHQGAFDLSYLRCLPNMIVSAPGDENDLQDLLYTAIKVRRPMAIRYPRGSGPGVPMKPEMRQLPVGKGEIIMDGQEAAILALGSTVGSALQAGTILREQGISCAVINARYAKPLDAELILKFGGNNGKLVTVEENSLAGGFGSGVLELLSASGCHATRVECIGLPDKFVVHGPQELFRAMYDLDAEGIVRRVKQAFPQLAVNPATLRSKETGQGQ